MGLTLLIPTVQDQADYSLRTRLDGREYNFHLMWNEREDRWYLDISDESDVVVCAGIKLVTNWPLLRYYHADPAVPPGELVVVDETSDGSPPEIDGLGENERCTLIYLSATDL